MSLSNKSLALLLVAAIVISLGGTIVSINKFSEIKIGRPVSVTGRATEGTGEVNLTITSNASCTVDTGVDFGTNTSRDADLTSDADNSALGFNDCSTGTTCPGILINNTGNVRLNVTFNSSVDGSDFLGAGSADDEFRYKIDETEKTADGCAVNGSIVWTNVPTTSAIVCDSLNYSTSDGITIDFNVNITSTTTTGLKQATITVGCEDVAV